MRTQLHLWSPADTQTVQPDLFPDDGAHLDVDRCPTCGKQRTRTPSGFVTCWNNCSGLQPAAPLDADEWDEWALHEGLTT